MSHQIEIDSVCNFTHESTLAMSAKDEKSLAVRLTHRIGGATVEYVVTKKDKVNRLYPTLESAVKSYNE